MRGGWLQQSNDEIPNAV